MKSTRLQAPQRSRGFSLIEVVVALALLGIALVSVIQLLSISLRATRQSSEYTRGLIYARSLMEEAYAAPELAGLEGEFELPDGYAATRRVRPVAAGTGEGREGEDGGGAGDERRVSLYEITVTVTWPPGGSTVLRGTKAVYEEAL